MTNVEGDFRDLLRIIVRPHDPIGTGFLFTCRLGFAVHRLYSCANLRTLPTARRLARALPAPDFRYGLRRLGNRCCIRGALKYVANSSYHRQSSSSIFLVESCWWLASGGSS